jgi:hypothetical protein
VNTFIRCKLYSFIDWAIQKSWNWEGETRYIIQPYYLLLAPPTSIYNGTMKIEKHSSLNYLCLIMRVVQTAVSHTWSAIKLLVFCNVHHAVWLGALAGCIEWTLKQKKNSIVLIIIALITYCYTFCKCYDTNNMLVLLLWKGSEIIIQFHTHFLLHMYKYTDIYNHVQQSKPFFLISLFSFPPHCYSTHTNVWICFLLYVLTKEYI